MNRPVVVENRKRKATASQDDPKLALVKVSTDFVWATDKTSVNAAAILFWRRALHHDCRFIRACILTLHLHPKRNTTNDTKLSPAERKTKQARPIGTLRRLCLLSLVVFTLPSPC